MEGFELGSTIAITLCAITGVVASAWAAVACYGGVSARLPTKQTKDGGIAILEGGVEIAQTVSQFEGCCYNGGYGGGCDGGALVQRPMRRRVDTGYRWLR